MKWFLLRILYLAFSIILGFLTYVNAMLLWRHLKGFFGMESVGIVAKSWLLIPIYGFTTILLASATVGLIYLTFVRKEP